MNTNNSTVQSNAVRQHLMDILTEIKDPKLNTNPDQLHAVVQRAKAAVTVAGAITDSMRMEGDIVLQLVKDTSREGKTCPTFIDPKALELASGR